jgi:hypothetical protein
MSKSILVAIALALALAACGTSKAPPVPVNSVNEHGDPAASAD